MIPIRNSASSISTFVCLILGLLLRTAQTGASTTNIAQVTITNSWRYNEAGVDLGTAWRQIGYDDSLWTNRRALFYNTSNVVPAPTNTPLVLGPTTYYFRTRFNLNAISSLVTLNASTIIDDGAVVYLNGAEVLRIGMPTGVIGYSTTASRSVASTVYEGPFSIPSSGLVLGTNVIAVELHQDSPTGNDVVFGLQLDAVMTYTNSPRMVLLINEVLANNHTRTNANGFASDWVELYNPSPTGIDVSDMSLSTDPGNPRHWVFPSGSTISANGYLVVEFNNELPVSSVNTGFKLKSGSDSIYLFERPSNGGIVVSSVSFGLQAADYSIGRIPDGSNNWTLNIPTRSARNVAGAVGNPLALKVNEWVAHSTGDNDWFEIYNPSAQPVILSSLYLTKDPANTPTQYGIPPLSFIGGGPNGYAEFHADKGTAKGANHTNFRLSSTGDTIAIVAADASTVIDAVTFGVQANHLDISEGRFPDGGASIVVFSTTTSPEQSNYLPISNAIVNEALSHTDLPLEDAIELYNPTPGAVDISGWFISNSTDNLKKHRVAPGTSIPARGYKVFYEYQFNSTNNGNIPFTLNSAHGDSVYLSQSDALGNLTSYRSAASFGAAENGVSFGRYQTSAGADFVAMSRRTFGMDNPVNLPEFRTGTGLSNAYPKVGPLVINEIMYHPPSIVGTNDNTQDEFIELHNISINALGLFDPSFPTNTWQFRSGIDFVFPTNVIVPGNGYLCLVPFDPGNNPSALANFRAKYGVAAGISVLGPYGGKLNNLGESIELYKPDTPQAPPHPDAGFIPYILVDRVQFANVPPWPTNADGGGASLQRRIPANYGNDPINWAAVAPTAGRDNGLQPIAVAPLITDVTWNSSTLHFVFKSQAGYVYDIQYKDALNSESWSLLKTVVGDGGVILIDTPTALPSRFYRIRVN